MKRQRDPSQHDIATLLSGLVGLTLSEAAAQVSPRGFRVEDRTGPGWFTQDQDPHRIALVLGPDRRVIRATVG